jgi:hypothetical protein
MRRRADGLGGPEAGPSAIRLSPCSNQLSGVLVAVNETNGQLLDALAHSAQSKLRFPLNESLRAPFAALSSSHRRRGGQCGVVLADAGFSDPERWQRLVTRGEHELGRADGDWLPTEDAIALASTLLMVAWHTVRVRPSLAGILLGMSESVVEVYRKLGVAELAQIARRRPQWVRPRWSDRPDVWRSVLETAEQPAADDSASIVLRCLKASAMGSSRLLSSLETAN